MRGSKKHWTQLPENKARLRANARRTAEKRRRKVVKAVIFNNESVGTFSDTVPDNEAVIRTMAIMAKVLIKKGHQEGAMKILDLIEEL